MQKLTLIIALLVFALLVQNTCPFGAAGKSTVAAGCDHCPLKHNFTVSTHGQKEFVSDPSPVHYPLYVFSIPKTVHTFQPSPIQPAQSFLEDNYQDALPEELLRPPRA
jgi:hypothetical protein